MLRQPSKPDRPDAHWARGRIVRLPTSRSPRSASWPNHGRFFNFKACFLLTWGDASSLNWRVSMARIQGCERKGARKEVYSICKYDHEERKEKEKRTERHHTRVKTAGRRSILNHRVHVVVEASIDRASEHLTSPCQHFGLGGSTHKFNVIPQVVVPVA